MSSKEKDKTFQEKLKSFFKINKGNFKGRVDFSLTADVVKDLSPEAPLNQRLKILKEMSEAVRKNYIEDGGVEKLWACVKDLLHPDVAKEYRHLVFSFFRCLIQGQYENLGIMRTHFFKLIKTHDVEEDTAPRLELLISLTDSGKDVLHFEEEIGPFLLNWMPEVTQKGLTKDFLAMLVNVIKFNAAHIDENVLDGLLQSTCFLCSWSSSQPVVLEGLQVLDAFVCYSNLPVQSLTPFIIALCRTVNVEAYCQNSWKIMRNLLGTHLGHSALYTMCRLMQDVSSWPDVVLLRGAVFYINMALWSDKRIGTLQYTATSVLPSILAVLSCENLFVSYEVMLGIQSLVEKYGLELRDPSWDIVLSIIEAIIEQIEAPLQDNEKVVNQLSVATHVYETVNTIEHLIEQRKFWGSKRRVFELIERCAPSLPEITVLRLIDYLSPSFTPISPEWIHRLGQLVERYFKQDKRTNVRVKALKVLSDVLRINSPVYEDDLIERIVTPHFNHIESDPDIKVRIAAAELLADLCFTCETKRCIEIMDILEKIMNRPFEQYPEVVVTSEADVKDVKTVVEGLIRILKEKLYHLPSSHALRAYKLLVSHLEAHYRKPSVLEYISSIRYSVFECFLQMRANAQYKLGFPHPESRKVRFSPYLAVDHKDGERAGGSSSPPPSSPAPSYPLCTVTHVSLLQACKLFIKCLKQEKDWKVLGLILQEVPQVMKNKALILSRHGNEIDLLASALCAMVSDKTLGLPDTLRNVPAKFTRSEFHSYVLPVLASLASYHGYLESGHQQRLIKCLEFGLVSRCARQCIVALTICALEMRDAMFKLLPEVLLNLSKISATVHIAIPLLEFLSTLTRLPKVFASFVQDQYMSVFAISMPYTNPFKYNHYTVSLAHHVVAVWFLKCRLPFRRDLVEFITMGLKANVIVPFEDNRIFKSDLVNEDSSNRKRSSSLTEQGSRRAVRAVSGAGRMDGRPTELKPAMDEALMNFHMELTETCIDLMARYTFSTCSALPKRLPTSEFLLGGGQSMSWLLGNKLVTVTTSGCNQKVLRNGLCDKCWTLCRLEKEPTSPEASTEQDGRPQKPGNHRQSNDATPLASQPAKDGGTPRPAGSTAASSVSSTPATAATSPVEEKRKPLGADTLHTHEPEPHKLEQIVFGSHEPEKQERQFCACWCQGWAEIHIRRPTGDMSWVMRIQNHFSYQLSPPDFPLADISTLFMPSLNTRSEQLEDYISGHKRINSENLPESEYDAILDHHFEQDTEGLTNSHPVLGVNTGPSGPILIPGSPMRREISRQNSRDSLDCDGDLYDGEESGKSRNPVRRSNSSPEMSSTWKNPFLHREKDKKESKLLPEREGSSDNEGKQEPQVEGKKPAKIKDSRVSCEAIPEESAGQGTTPPTSGMLSAAASSGGRHPGHPPLQACHSYPGSAEEERPPCVPEAGSHTVPPSPTSQSLSLLPMTSTPLNGSAKGLQPVPQPLHGSEMHHAAAEVKSPSEVVQQLQTSGGQLSLNTSNASDKVVKDDLTRPDPSALPPLAFKRGRGHTISVMSPVRKPRIEWSHVREDSPRTKDTPRSGISPSFVFLQLYHSAHFGSKCEKPLLVSQSQVVQRAVKNLDRMPPYETHKIGVLYVGPGQASSEAEILRNQFGSLRYAEFLQRLGTLVTLKDAAAQNIFLGGLDSDGNDGKYATIWQDDITQVTFHVATLMPNKENDPLCNSKKLHIGNDFVSIVYNESGEDYNIQTVKCQFNYACVVIEPLEHSTNQVTVKTRDDLMEHIGHSEPKIVSDQNLALLARQLALHADLASMISRSLKAEGQNPFASNWLERLRQIKRLRVKVLQENTGSRADGVGGSSDKEVGSPPRRIHMDDFTEYT
ncbi:tuberin isoform X2 [Bacillus rossius redtenbacheri]|uniref:tuberin isoform X2 n=1 Tax=Bacillus rossius redtenbacheri TaxID=93214 RepID=UPI002FDC8743